MERSTAEGRLSGLCKSVAVPSFNKHKFPSCMTSSRSLPSALLNKQPKILWYALKSPKIKAGKLKELNNEVQKPV